MQIRINSENHRMMLIWEYKIRKQKKTVNEVEYSYYSASFPAELQSFLDTRDVWLREDEGQVYLFSDDVDDGKKIHISKSGKESFSFMISKKLFPRVDERNFLRITFDGEVILLSLF